jgi:hypothetical protein
VQRKFFKVNSQVNITLKNQVSWDVTLYRLLNSYQHYVWSSCLHLQYQAVKEVNSIFTQLFTWKNVTAIYIEISAYLMTLCLSCHKNIIMWNIYVCITLPSKYIIILFFISKIHTFHICSIKINEKQKTTEVNLLSAYLHKAFGKCQRIEQMTVKSRFINSEKNKDTLEKTRTV